MRSLNTILMSLALVSGLPAYGQLAAQWRLQAGGNGHWYQLVPATGISWASARANAQAAGGELATPATAAESAFVVGMFQGHSARSPWIGLRQSPDGTEPAGGWGWVTGEPMPWMNWSPGEPNGDGVSFADEANLWLVGEPGRPLGTWNDWTAGGPDGYLIEWNDDCNGDGEVDFGQIVHGSLMDSDGNGIPDECEGVNDGQLVVLDSQTGFASQQGIGGWRYRFDSGAGTAVQDMPHLVSNGYAAFGVDPTVWCVARSFGAGGSYAATGGVFMHTATVSDCSSPGILRRPRRQWASPVPYSGTIHLSGRMGVHAGMRVRLLLYVNGSATPAWQQLGTGQTPRIAAIVNVTGCTSLELVVEPEDDSCHSDGIWCRMRMLAADCDADGVPDEHQIAEGLVPDVDSNGIPDACDCPADLDRSGVIGAEDLAAVLFAWGTDGGKTPEADIDGDGTVGAEDLSVLIAAWGGCPG